MKLLRLILFACFPVFVVYCVVIGCGLQPSGVQTPIHSPVPDPGDRSFPDLIQLEADTVDTINLPCPPGFRPLANCPFDCYALDLVAHGDYIYVAAGCCGLEIVDVSDPANPQIVAEYQMYSTVLNPGWAYANHVFLQVSDSTVTVFVTSVVDGVHMVDCTNPHQPQLIGKLDLDKALYGMIEHNGFWFIAAGGDGLVIADLLQSHERTIPD